MKKSTMIQRLPGLKIVLLRLGILAVTVLIIGGGAWFYYKGTSANIRRNAQDMLASIADLKVGQIANWMKERRADAETAHNNMLFRQFLAEPDNPRLREALLRYMTTFQRVYEYRAVTLFDKNGSVLLSAPPDASRQQASVAEDVQSVLRSREIVFKDLHRAQAAMPISMDFLIPFRINPKADTAYLPKADGVLVLVIDPNRFFFPLVQSWPTSSRTSESLLIRREGDMVVFLNELRHRANSALNLRLPVTTNSRLPAAIAVQGYEGMVEGEDYRGVSILAAVRRIPDTPWFMVVKQDQEEIYAPMRQEAWTILLIVSLLLALAALGFILTWRHQKLVFIQKDLAGRKHTEESLRENEEKYRTLIAKMMNAFGLHEMIFDDRGEPADYRFLEVNPVWEKTVGIKAESVIGKRIKEIMPNIEDSWIQLYGKIVKTGIPEEFEEYNAATHKYYHVYAYCPSPGKFAVFFNDITARKQDEETIRKSLDHTERSRKALLSAYEDLKHSEDTLRKLNSELDIRIRERTAQIEASNKDLESFSYSVSHDLRAPLRAINGFGQILAQDYADRLDDEGRRLLGVISGETKRMGQLIDDLLTFSRLGRQAVEPTLIDMTTLAGTVFQELAGHAPERIIQFECKPVPPAQGDPAMLRVALTNLLSNAIKFTMPRNPAAIEVGHISKDDQTIYYVKDNGVGFDMKYANKLFGVFQRLHSTEEFEGTGVGLSMVQRIIHRHGGSIWAESKADQGTTFFFTVNNTKK